MIVVYNSYVSRKTKMIYNLEPWSTYLFSYCVSYLFQSSLAYFIVVYNRLFWRTFKNEHTSGLFMVI